MDRTVFERVDLQQLCSFMLFQEETATQTGSYDERLENAKMLAFDAFKNSFPNNFPEEFEDALETAFSAHQAICTEIGIKLGAKLMLQLMQTEDKNL